MENVSRNHSRAVSVSPDAGSRLAPRFVGVPSGSSSAVLLGKANRKKKNGKGSKQGTRGGQSVQSVRLSTVMVRGPRFPPPFEANPTYKCKRRWVSAESVAISNLAFSIASGNYQFKTNLTTTSGVCFVECWRIKRISVWTINYVDNSTTATIEPAGVDLDTNNFNDRDQVFLCSSRSEAEPGSMVIVPARDTPLGSWHRTSTVNSSATLFTFNVDYGGASSGNWATVTLDIDFEFVLTMVGVPRGYTFTSGATTAGTLSGSNLGSNAMLLQGVNVIQ